jgi:hypothetical protein
MHELADGRAEALEGIRVVQDELSKRLILVPSLARESLQITLAGGAVVV